MCPQEVAALKMGRGSSLIRSKHRHADILNWEDDISTIATVDAPPAERALLASTMRTRSAGSRRSDAGSSFSTAVAAPGDGRRAWSAHAGRQGRNPCPPVSDGKTAMSPNAGVASSPAPAPALAPVGEGSKRDDVAGSAGRLAPDVPSVSHEVGKPSAPAALQNTTAAAAGAATIPGNGEGGGLLASGVAGDENPDREPAAPGPPLAAVGGGGKKMGRPTSARRPSGRARSGAEDAQSGSQAHLLATQADQPEHHASAEEVDQAQGSLPAPQRRLIRFLSEVAGRGGAEQGSPQQRHQGGNQPSLAEVPEGRAGGGQGAEAVSGEVNQAQALHGSGSGPAGVRAHAHSAPTAATRPAVFGRSTVIGGSGQARGAEQVWSGGRGSNAGGSGGGCAGSGASGQHSLVDLLGGTGGAANVPQSLLQVAAEAEAEGVEDVDDAAGMDGEDAVMMQGQPKHGSTSSRQLPVSAGAAGRKQLSPEAQLQYFGHCALGTSRRSSAHRDRPGHHTHHTRRVRSALATSTTTGAAKAAPTTMPPHLCPRPVNANITGQIPATLFRRAVSAPRALRHPYGASEMSSTGSAAGRVADGQPSAGPAAIRARASSAPRARRPLSARQQELLQQPKEGPLEPQQRRRPQSAGPIVESPSACLSQWQLHRASTSASKASSSWHLGGSSSHKTGGPSTQPSMSCSHISTAGFPAQVHRGVGEGHDPHHLRRTSLDRPSSACTTYNPEKAAAVYGVRSAARRGLIRGMAAAVMAGRHTPAGAHLNTAPSGSVQGTECDDGAGGVGVGLGAAACNGVLARCPSGVPVATHKGKRQQQWLHQRMLHSSALHQQHQQQQQQGQAEYLRSRSEALSNEKNEGMGNLRAGLQPQGSTPGDGDCQFGKGLQKALGGWSSAGPSHTTHHHTLHHTPHQGAVDLHDGTRGGIKGRLGGARPASAPLQSCAYDTAAAAYPPPLPPPASHRLITPPTAAAAAAAAAAATTAGGHQEQQGGGSRPSSARPMSGNSRPSSGRPSSARNSCAAGSAGLGDGGGGYSGGSSVTSNSGNGYNWNGDSVAGLAIAHGANHSKIKQADWDFQCEKQELGIVDEDSGEGSDSDGL
ncbi:hypothetical protein DUNSADRAFT_15984 [Dunaliella salina]|uniref:Uncharacterized protein n=1 Tax=Dunaliella salina TaxID=3046 RepID=A0ABQ7G4G0_DUNSA|nr:hypothetical protein DUNSADRAFT_15984 [Dunaliella salina]|eukprot:KAF5829500.1 hypothetical protein DUNSADRAFT_15984 [Dunaliella salina]